MLTPNKGRFTPGTRHSAATEFKPGERRGALTEFKRGQPARNKLPVGAVTFRTLDGVQRAFVKVAEPNKWRERAKVVWEQANGQPVPRGLVIHHKDRDALNDVPGNLEALTRKQHALEHMDEAKAAGFSSEEARARAVAARHAPKEAAAC